MNNNDYPILQFGKDFFYSKKETILTGKRIKKLVETKDGEAILKYPPNNYITSEVCSEKIAHELANKLNFDCARIELAECEDGTIGILSFLFVSPPNITHTDASAILKTPDTNNSSRSTYYTLSNIERSLNRIDAHLFRYFMRIMAFDALIGEQDRHEENWGILDKNGIKEISPLYDNGDSLVRDLAAERAITEYSSGIKRFDDYINRSRTCIYKEPSLIKEGESHKYKHFEMIDRLLTLYPALIQDDLAKISSLDDNEIVDIVSCIPEQLLTGLHKSYIIKYITKRKQILTEKLNNFQKGLY